MPDNDKPKGTPAGMALVPGLAMNDPMQNGSNCNVSIFRKRIAFGEALQIIGKVELNKHKFTPHKN